MPERIYLATPYSDPDPSVRQVRYETACIVAAELMSRGRIVFSPVAHSHGIALHGVLNPLDRPFWLAQDMPHLLDSDVLLIVHMPGWDQSEGIKAEVAAANKHGIEVRHFDPESGSTA